MDATYRVLVMTVGFDEADDQEYWLSKTPYEGLEAVESMRQVIYGYTPSSIRLQRALAVAQLSSELEE